MAVPLRWRPLVYAATFGALILVYHETRSAAAAFIASMIVAFGGIEIALRRRSVPSLAEEDDLGGGSRWTVLRAAWLLSLFAVFHVIPTFGWGATRILIGVVLLFTFIELDNVVETVAGRR